MDDSTALIALAATGAAVALGAIMVGSGQCGKESRKTSLSSAQTTPVDVCAPTDQRSDDQAVEKKKTSKKKRRHKGKRSSKKKPESLLVTGAKKPSELTEEQKMQIKYSSNNDEDTSGQWEPVKKSTKRVSKRKQGGNSGGIEKAATQLPTVKIALNGQAARVIGKQGSTIQRIQLDSGARLNIDRDSDMLEISGTQDAIDAAQAEVEKVMAVLAGGGGGRGGRGPCQRTLDLGDRVGAVVGRGGSMIKSLQADYNCSIDIARDGDNTATISGETDEEVEACLARVIEIISNTGSSGSSDRNCFNCGQPGHLSRDCPEDRQERSGGARRAPKAFEDTVEVGDRMGAVIGRGGETIRRIQEDNGCVLDTDKEAKTVTIGGDSAAAVAAARVQIEDILAQPARGGFGGGNVTRTVDLETRQNVFAVLGSGGAKVQQLQNESGARISIDKESHVATIRAADDETAQAAEEMIRAVLATQSIAVKIDLQAEQVGAVIGRGGATISRIQAETGARLDLKKKGTENTLFIFGEDSERAAAEAQVREVLKQSSERNAGGGRGGRRTVGDGEIEDSMEVDSSCVGSIIGRGGETIRRIQDESGVSAINVNKKSDTPSVTFIGTPEAVTLAKAAVADVIAERENGGGSRGGDRACYNCGQSGHLSRDCPETRQDRNTDRNCYNCGQPGHISRDCTEERQDRGGGDRACYNCGQTGHLSRDCSEPRKEAGEAGGDVYTDTAAANGW